MKNILLLSSTKFLINNPQLMFEKPLKDMRMAYITTAAKGVDDLEYMDRAKEIFKTNEYNYEELDLDGKNEQWLRDYFKNFDVIYVQGGNTFYLLKAMRESGFDKVIKELLPQGLIYIGASAGAYIACPTIEMAGYRHQDKYDHYGVTDLTGLNLVPFLITVHYSPEYAEIVKERVGQSKYPVRTLTDNQAILIQDSKEQLIGDPVEVKL
jgi:dipeptidase E